MIIKTDNSSVVNGLANLAVVDDNDGINSIDNSVSQQSWDDLDDLIDTI